MASAVACNGPALANHKKMFAEPSASAAPVTHSALSPAAVTGARNTQGKEVRRHDDDDTSGRARDSDLPSFFSHQDVFDRFGAPTTLGRLLGLMEDAGAAFGGSSGIFSTARRGLPVVKQDDDAVYLKMSMPGLGKEHVKVWAEKNSLMIEGEGAKEPWDGDKDDDAAAVPKYSGRVEMPADAVKMDKIKAEMKNGVLRVTVPKIKKEERKDVFQVQIE